MAESLHSASFLEDTFADQRRVRQKNSNSQSLQETEKLHGNVLQLVNEEQVEAVMEIFPEHVHAHGSRSLR